MRANTWRINREVRLGSSPVIRGICLFYRRCGRLCWLRMHRRDFLKSAGVVALGGLRVQPAGSVRTARTSVLEIAYHQTGDASAFPIILLHGFPDDAHAYDGVAPLLAQA